MTVEIPLTKGHVTIVDDEDADLVNFNWSAHVHGCFVYAYRKVEKKNNYIHRVILIRILGRELETGEMVDHANGNGLDNRRCNLRLANKAENQRNQRRRKDNTSGVKGVDYRKNSKKWRARIRINGREIQLGLFATAELAHGAYCEAAVKYHGEFANFGTLPEDSE